MPVGRRMADARVQSPDAIRSVDRGPDADDSIGARVKGIVPLALAACLAAVLVSIGTHDLECYENAFCSLARGTEATAVTVFGQPVYTMSIGLGTRLPLHGNLGASPAAALARWLPDPATHWLLLALSMGAAALLVVHALQPLGGPLVAWGTVAALFWSQPMVAYTVFNDWPETAVTYCALVGGIFAPHALVLAAGPRAVAAASRWVWPSLLAVVFSLLAAAHPGYWPQLVAAVALSSLLVLVRPMDRLRDRLTTLAAMACVGALALAMHVPDLAREQALGAGLGRDAQGPTGFLLQSNSFPWQFVGPREPFTMAVLALAAILIVCAAGRRWWLFVWATAAISLGFGAAAVSMSPSAITIGSFVVSPSTTWTLRDPAVVFAAMSAAFACAALVGGRRVVDATLATAARAPIVVRGIGVALLVLCAGQGVGYATAMLGRLQPPLATPWNHDWSNQATRAAARGMPAATAISGARIALFPGVRQEMRLAARASTAWSDAGYQLVTAWTKNRTMAGLVRPNDILFDQTTDLPSQVLCDSGAAPFLRLSYLILPDGQACDGWRVLPGARIDGRWSLAQLTSPNTRVFAVQPSTLTPDVRDEPAFGGNLRLVSRLVPQEGSSLVFENGRLSVTLNEAPRDHDLALVLPVAYDPAWKASSGRALNLAGLLAVEDVAASRLDLTFSPDMPLRVRALGMLAAQAAGAIGIVLASVFLADNHLVASTSRQRVRGPRA